MIRLSLVFALLTVATLSSAQIIDDPDFRMSVDVQLVQLPVSVEDKHGMPIRDLQKEQELHCPRDRLVAQTHPFFLDVRAAGPD